MFEITLSLLIVAVITAAALAWLGEREPREDSERQWQAALGSADGQVGRMMMAASRPLSRLPQIYERSMSPQYKWLQRKLVAGGELYGASVEVFLSVQVACALAAAGILAGLIVADVGLMWLGLGAAVGLCLLYLPYNLVQRAVEQRVEAVNQELPTFADLLQMPLTAGMGVVPALEFTVAQSRGGGVVVEEVDNLLGLLQSRAVRDAEAYMITGERLGTPEAVAFFNALLQAHTEGGELADTIAGQAESLRENAHRHRQEHVNKMPVKISVRVAIHLLPLLLGVALLPLVYSMATL